MKSTPSVNSAFGIPVYELQINDFENYQDELIRLILDMREQDPGRKVSNQGGWHSKNDLHQSEATAIAWLIAEINRNALSCIKHSKTVYPNAKVGLASCWANVNEAGDWNAPHAHFPADWSGVCYIPVSYTHLTLPTILLV